MTQPTDRPGIDHLTSDMLDQLYADLDWAREQTLAAQQEATEVVTRAERAEATLNAVRKLHDRWECDANVCAVCVDGYGNPVSYPCPTIAVLDQHGQTPS